MSRTDSTPREWRKETAPEVRAGLGMIRRMAVTLSKGAFWQTVGHLLLDSVTRETRDAEVFSGVGYFARPKAGHRAEAIVVFVGGSSNPIVIATRDEDARKAMADIAEDESTMFNSLAKILVKSDGTIEIGSGAGMESTIKADTYRAAEDNMLTAMKLAWSQLLTIPTIATGILAFTTPQQAVVGGFVAAIEAFQLALTAATYKTTIAKVR